MWSLHLSGLSAEQRAELERRLRDARKGISFICEKEIDLKLHQNVIDMDHDEKNA